MTDRPPRTQSEAHDIGQQLAERGHSSADLGEVRRFLERLESPAFAAFDDERLGFNRYCLLSRIGTLADDPDELLAIFERMLGPEFADVVRLDTAHFAAFVLGHLIFLTSDPDLANARLARLVDEVFDRYPSEAVAQVTAESLFNVGAMQPTFAARLAAAERIERELYIAFPTVSIGRQAAAAYVNAGVLSDDPERLEALAEHVVGHYLSEGASAGPSLDAFIAPSADAPGFGDGIAAGPGPLPVDRSRHEIAARAAALFSQAIQFAPGREQRSRLAARITDDLYAAHPVGPIAVRVAWSAYARASAGDPGATGRRVLKQMQALLGQHSSHDLAKAAVMTCLTALPTNDDDLLELVDRVRALILEHDDAPDVLQFLAHIYLKAVPHLLANEAQAHQAFASALELLRRALVDPEVAEYPIFGGYLELERFPDGMRDELIRFLQEVLPG